MPANTAQSAARPQTAPHDIDIRVGRNLRSARNLRGLTQKELGAGVGLTLQQIQKYENGSNRINVSRLHQFSEILQVPVAQFFSGPAGDPVARGGTHTETPRTQGSDALAFSAEDFELLTLFKSVSPRMKRRLICLVEEMAETSAAA